MTTDRTSEPGRRWSPWRLALAAVLLSIVLVLVVLLFVNQPNSPAVTALIVVVIGLAVGVFTHFFVPTEMQHRTKRTLAVGFGMVTILAALLAVPTSGDSPPLASPADAPAPMQVTESGKSESTLLSARVIRGPVGDAPNCARYAVPNGAPTTVPTPPRDTPESEREWIKTVGALDVGTTSIEVRLQGVSEKAVVLNELRVVVESVEDPSAKETYNVAFGCGGAFGPRFYEIDLGDETPSANPIPGEDASGKKRLPQPFPLQVSASDPETLIVSATTAHKDVAWHLEIPWYSAGEEGTLVIRDADGKSFQTLSPNQIVNGYFYNGTDWEQWCSAKGSNPC